MVPLFPNAKIPVYPVYFLVEIKLVKCVDLTLMFFTQNFNIEVCYLLTVFIDSFFEFLNILEQVFLGLNKNIVLSILLDM